MKVINYMCNRCGKQIDSNGIYAIYPERLDQDGESTKGLPDEVSDEIYDLLEDSHLCLDCLKKTLKYFNAPTVPNPEFEKALLQAEKPIELVPVIDIPMYEDKLIEPVPQPKEEPEVSKPPVPNPSDTLTKEVLQDLIEKQGMPVKQVAEKLNLEISGIYIKMKKWGIQPPSKRTAKKTEKLTAEEVKRLYLGEGKNILEVAKKLGVNSQELRSFMVKNGISKNAKEVEKYLKSREQVTTD